MSRKASPKSRQFDERAISRVAESFVYGMFNDAPSSEIPEGSVHLLRNMVSLGGRIQSRSGTQEWGDRQANPPVASAQFPSVTISPVTITGTKVGNERSWIFGDRWNLVDSELPIDYHVWDYLHFQYTNELGELVDESEAIVRVDTDTNTAWTSTEISEQTIQTSVKLFGRIHSALCNPIQRTVLIHVGSKVYISEVEMLSWKEVPILGRDRLANSQSTIFTYGDSTYITSRSGMFKLFTINGLQMLAPITGYQPNLILSDSGNKLEDVNKPADPLSVFCRRRIPTYTNITATDRMEGDITWESSSTEATQTHPDYCVEWTKVGIGANTPSRINISDSNIPPTATHVSIYCTKNSSYDGIYKEHNNPEFYTWELDVPLGEAWKLQVWWDGSGHRYKVISSAMSSASFPTTITTAQGLKYELPVVVYLGHTPRALKLIPFQPTNPLDLSMVGQGRVVNMNNEGLEQGDPIETGSEIETNKPLRIWTPAGKSTTFEVDFPISGGSIGQLNAFGYAPVGTYKSVLGRTTDGRVYRANVTVFNEGNGTVELLDGETLSWNVGFSFPSIGEYSRVALSTVSDTVLTARQPTMPLVTRFMKPLPSGDLAAIGAPFLFSAESLAPTLCYSQIRAGYEYQIGQYNPVLQFHDFKENGITEIGVIGAKVYVRTAYKTFAGSYSAFTDTGKGDTTKFVYTIPMMSLVSDNIGSAGRGSSCKMAGENLEYVLTSEPALRKFTGGEYGENLLAGRCMNWLRSLQPAYSSCHNSAWGFVLWGKK